MPAYETFLPADATNILLTHKGKTISIDSDVHCFNREGEDENSLILALCGGDLFIGEVLEGWWKKGWDSTMDADQAFTAILDGLGVLEFEGEVDVADGRTGNGWINGHLPIPLMDGTEIITSLQLPIDITAGPASRDIYLEFYLRGTANQTAAPYNETNYFNIRIVVDEVGTLISLRKRVSGAITVYDQGFDYTMTTGKGTGDVEGTIWRMTLHEGDPSETGVQADRHMHVYLRQNVDLDSAEESAENELLNSPYDISDLLFDVAYPSYQIRSQNATYFDSGGEAKVGYLGVDYPDFNIKYDLVEASRFKNEVELWDGDPDNGGIKVYDVDHVFANDVYTQNGLVRILVDEGATSGLIFYTYDPVSGQYERLNSEWFYELSSNLQYTYFDKIVYLSPEKIAVTIKTTDSAVNDDNIYVKNNVILNRGSYLSELSDFIVYPLQENVIRNRGVDGKRQWGYAGDGAIGDDELGITNTNTTLSDNFMIMFDDAGDTDVIVFLSNQKPAGTLKRFETNAAGRQTIEDYASTQIATLKLWYGGLPFALVANLFIEAEDATATSGTLVTDVLASPPAGADNAVELDAQNEYISHNLTAGTDILEGRYLCVYRVKIDNTSGNDMYHFVRNDTDTSYRNEENASISQVLTTSFAYYSLVFDVTETDVDDGDTIQIRIAKALDNADVVTVDYFLVIPIGDGESFPQDLAHNAMRTFKQEIRHFVK